MSYSRLAADNISNCAGRMNPVEQRSELQVRTRGLPGDVSLSVPDPTRAIVVWFGLESVDDSMVDDPGHPRGDVVRPAWREAIGTCLG